MTPIFFHITGFFSSLPVVRDAGLGPFRIWVDVYPGFSIRITGILLVLVLLPVSLYSQQPLHHHPVHSAIEQAAQNNEISRSQAMLQKIYAGFRPDLLDSRFRNDSAPPIRCMTPAIREFYQTRDRIDAGIADEIETMITPDLTAATHSYISDSGNFVFYYETEGEHAVPAGDIDGNGLPDYVEQAGVAADSSYRYQVEELGFTDFLKDEPYVIHLKNINPFGFISITGSTTEITIHSTFEDFPPNTHPEGDRTGALYATIAHEMKHAIQYAVNRWHGDAGSTDWIEMDATLMEEVVFPDVNDYYNYIMDYNSTSDDWDRDRPHSSSIFGNPQNPTPRAYYHVSWMIYYYEQFGAAFWVDVWDEIRRDYLSRESGDPYIGFTEAMELILAEHGADFGREFITNHLWHATSGPDLAPSDFGFLDRINYPHSKFEYTLMSAPDSLMNDDVSLQPLGAHYVDVHPSNITIGQPMITLTSTEPGIGVAVIGYFRDGTTDVQLTLDPVSDFQSIQTIWSWSDLVDMNLVVVNTNSTSNAGYTLTVTSTVPEEDTISQNYPNPFNPTTQIEFSLTESKHAKIEVFDRIGRKVATLVDERLPGGFHTVSFDGSGLASGVYFYRIVTDQAISSKKMVLIK